MSKKKYKQHNTVASSFIASPNRQQPYPTRANQLDTVVKLPLDRLMPYPNQPFHAYEPDKLAELVEDICDNGILSPLLVRPFGDGYQILSGHNRAEAAKLANLTTVPCIIKTANDDDAALILVNTNLNQRQGLLPSEKAKAYQLRMNVLNRQGKRTDLLWSQEAEKIDTATEIAENESRANVFRYLRLNYLLPEWMDIVDSSKLQLKAAVRLSYLSPARQEELFTLCKRRKITLNESRVQIIREFAANSDEPLEQSAIFLMEKNEKKTVSVSLPLDKDFIKELRSLVEQSQVSESMKVFLQGLLQKTSDGRKKTAKASAE